MKKIMILIGFFILFSCQSNDNPKHSYEKFYDDHKNDENTTSFNMLPFIFKLFVDKTDPDTKEALNQIEEIKFLIKDKSDKRFIKKLYDHLPEKNYKPLLTVKDDRSKIEFLAFENKDVVEEVVMVIYDENSCIIMNIEGDFNKESVKKLSEKINIDEIKNYR